tara:strand:- start:3029 stop:3799 length:771 start_codon:yes stop_codon:yes gene_type:complete
MKTTISAHNPKRYKVGRYFTTVKPLDIPFDLSDAQRATEQAFDFLNERLFNGKLERVVITLQSSSRSYGHCSVNRIWNNGTMVHSKHEINMSVDYLSRDPMKFLGTLVHEMVHAYHGQCVPRIEDVNLTNGYHKKKSFARFAETVGLVVTKDQGHTGWSRTRVSMSILDGVEPVAEQAISELRLKPFWQKRHFDFQRGSGIGQRATGTDTGTDEIKPKPLGGNSKMKKWSCGCTIVRCAVELVADCQQCDSPFELA